MIACEAPEVAKLGTLSVSRICFGCGSLGSNDWGDADETEMRAAVRLSLEVGVNFFDTADVYGLGRSETLLAQTLGAQRTAVAIASKGGVRWVCPRITGARAETFRDNSPAYLAGALTASLQRLELDCIPLYFLHWPDPKCRFETTMEALAQFREEGKIRHIGLSNVSAKMLQKAHRLVPLTAVQVQYSLINRQAELEIIPCCRELGIAILVYGALAQGLLSGKYEPGHTMTDQDRRQSLPHFQKNGLQTNSQLLDGVRRIAEECGRSPAQIAVRWVLDNPDVTCSITGVKTCAQVRENMAVLGWRLAPHQREALNALKH